MAAQSLTSLHRAEKSLYRELCATFDTMQRLDAAHCSADTYLEIARVYNRLGDEHSALCRELERRYEERLIVRHEEEEIGVTLQADRSKFLWDSSVAD